MEERPKANWLAIASFVLGLLSLIGAILYGALNDLLSGWFISIYTLGFAIPGLIVGIIALAQIGKKGGRRRDGTMAVAGTILSAGYGWLGFLFGLAGSVAASCFGCLVGADPSQCFAFQERPSYTLPPDCYARDLLPIAYLALPVAGIVIIGIWLRRLHARGARAWVKALAIVAISVLALFGFALSTLGLAVWASS